LLVDTAGHRRETGGSVGPLLSVEGLSVHFASKHGLIVAVDDVSFALRRGERVALIGESGSGKTATCLAVSGFLTQPNVTVTSRRMDFDGVQLAGVRRSRVPSRTPGLAMVFQDAMTSLDPVWKVKSQLGAVLRSTGRRSRAEVAELSNEWLHRVGLHDTARVLHSRPYELSGGMRQRVMLALALCSGPKLLIADEPTSALDASLAREALELMMALTEELGTALLIVSHDIRLSQEYCDRSLVMYGGRIVEEMGSRSLGRAARHPYTVGLLSSVPTLESTSLDELPTIAAPLGVGQVDPQGGCSFRPRCRHASERCSTPPAPFVVDEGHLVRCWYAGSEMLSGAGKARVESAGVAR
jgi:peptide/nickel transport system ATP-binding protein